MTRSLRKFIVQSLASLGLLNFASSLQVVSRKLEGRLLAAIFPRGRFVNKNGGLVFVNYRDETHVWYSKTNLYFQSEYDAFSKLLDLSKPKVVLDIGAHWGGFLALLDSDPRAMRVEKVVCVEPDPKNLPQLQMTASRVKNFKVEIVQAAVGHMDAVVPGHRGGGTCLQTYNGESRSKDDQVPVRLVTVATMLGELGIIPDDVTHIKIDIDGFEPTLFTGNPEFFRMCSSLIISEFWAKGMLSNSEEKTRDYLLLVTEVYHVLLLDQALGKMHPVSLEILESFLLTEPEKIRNLALVPKTQEHLLSKIIATTFRPF